MILEEILQIISLLLIRSTCVTLEVDDRQLEVEDAACSSSQQINEDPQIFESSISSHQQQDEEIYRRNHSSSHEKLIRQPTDESDRLELEEAMKRERVAWEDKIFNEYDSAVNSSPDNAIGDNMSAEQNSRPRREKPSFRESLERSLRTTLETFVTILLIPFPFGLFCFEMNRLCNDEHSPNGTTPRIVRTKTELISDQVEDVLLNLWFPATLALLFGWTEFKKHYLVTFYVGFATGAMVVMYKCYLFIFHAITELYFTGDAMIFVAVICSSILVARNFRRGHSNHMYSYFHIFMVIITEILAALILGWIYKFAVVPFYNEVTKKFEKVIIALSTVAISIIPSSICYIIALNRSSGIVDPERGFLLVYMVREGPIVLYRMMQADFKDLRLFTGFSVLHGLFSVFKRATNGIRQKAWTTLVKNLKKRNLCCKRLELLPYNFPRKRRLDTDLEIQEMIFQYNIIILSQIALVLYDLSEAKFHYERILLDALKRVAVALSIEVLFNFVCIFIQIHFKNLPVRRVWSKFWKRHLIANFIFTVVMVLFFSQALFTVYRVRLHDDSHRNITFKNCSLPFM